MGTKGLRVTDVVGLRFGDLKVRDCSMERVIPYPFFKIPTFPYTYQILTMKLGSVNKRPSR